MLSPATNRRLAAVLVASQLTFFAQVPLAQAAMIGTPQALQEQQQQVDRAQLRGMLDNQDVQKKLQEYGVPREQVEARINSLTPAELAQFNQQLQQEPAGAGIVGIIVLFLVIFIITDMLCATDIFSFIKCIR
ncbi:PA2779 family protein [Pseudomonas solani]|uniref:PA2779 family protein n=1 Tax=Pseudomonas solani TaxID=2731552 RepID=A0AAU7Y0A5_9PSED|nr:MULTISPECIES: PA2779 family protein [unclassified Pseudomonas]MCU9949398.1 PA2779 family protein [Pseudomonas sp. PDM13]WCD79475.1 PA2779 family protein [Pseudomonas sp. TUM22785]